MTSDKYQDKNLYMTGRLTPIGGASSDTNVDEHMDEKLELLKEHEKLNASLAALTRHFAHVQLRLQQVIYAPTQDDRDNLLHELHEFASSGIPDVMCEPSFCKNLLTHEPLVDVEKCSEKEMIDELKQKLDELEHYAAASGSLEGAPTMVMIEKQRVLINELQDKLHLQLDDSSVSRLSSDELRKVVDQAISQLTNPVKLKENLISQMNTQINDLENFIEFLKHDSQNSIGKSIPSSSIDIIQPISIARSVSNEINDVQSNVTSLPTINSLSFDFKSTNNSSNMSQLLKKFLFLTQFYTLLLLTCGTRTQETSLQIRKDLISKKHYGDIRAKLEIAIAKLIDTVQTSKTSAVCMNNDEIEPVMDASGNIKENSHDPTDVIICVRQDLGHALRELLEHGLYETIYSTNSIVCGCFASKTGGNYPASNEKMHIWNLFLKYYEIKKGNEFANSPARKLSQSFALDIIGGKPITVKQCLLSAIDTIIKLHVTYTTANESCFKSFVCQALNEKKLVIYLRMILQTTSLIDNYYQPWSYMKQTGFSDALHSLDRLTSIDFHLPIDISVRRFMNSRDLIQ